MKRTLAVAVLTALTVGLAGPASAIPYQSSPDLSAQDGVALSIDKGVGTAGITVSCRSDTATSIEVQAEVQQRVAYAFSNSGFSAACGVEPITTTATVEFAVTDQPFVEGAAEMTVWFGPFMDDFVSDIATTVSVVVPPPPPVTKPGAPSSLATTVSSQRVRLSWAPPTNNGNARVDQYQAQRGSALSTRRTLMPSARSTLFGGLRNGTRYAFRVRAHNEAGWSGWVTRYATAKAPPPPRAYRNCTAANNGIYPHGVGRVGARDKTSGTPVTTFKVSTKGYQMNDGRVKSRGQYDLDRDNDGIACEKR